MKFILFTFILLTFSTSSFADRIPIAVLDLDTRRGGLSKKVAVALDDSIRNEFSKRDSISVISRELMFELSKEKGIKTTKEKRIKTPEEWNLFTRHIVQLCIVFKVKMVVFGHVFKHGKEYEIVLRAVDVEKKDEVIFDTEGGEVRMEEIPLLIPPLVGRLLDCILGKPETVPEQVSSVEPPIIGKNVQGYTEYRNVKDSSILILIPSAEFFMGSNSLREGDDERPMHRVKLDAFYIDKYEVTVGQFKAYCRAMGKRLPLQSDWNKGDNFPVTRITWGEASEYAAWAGKRLPTEAEWEMAARGTDGRTYPWGRTWDEKKCNNDITHEGSWGFGFPSDGYRNTAPVGCFPEGASPYGLMDMAGNVSEWCHDWYDCEYYKSSPDQNPKGAAQGTARVVRGGSFWDHKDSFKCTYRYDSCPCRKDDKVGFRCARDAK